MVRNPPREKEKMGKYTVSCFDIGTVKEKEPMRERKRDSREINRRKECTLYTVHCTLYSSISILC